MCRVDGKFSSIGVTFGGYGYGGYAYPPLFGVGVPYLKLCL